MNPLRSHSSSGLRICLLFASFALIACNGTTPATPTPPNPTPTNAPAVTPSSGSARGFAIAIGLNEIDPTHYGTSGALGGCEADANDMEAIAVAEGFMVTKLLTRQATRDAVLNVLAQRATEMEAGDTLVVSYSGHGGQVPDRNGDEVDDGLDETWCLWDGQLIDDELHECWRRFKDGVRILVLSDSCHSGTVVKSLKADFEQPQETRVKELEVKWQAARRPAKLDRQRLLNEGAMKERFMRDRALRDRVIANPSVREIAGGFEVSTGEDKDEVFVARSLSPVTLAKTYSRAKADYDARGAAASKEDPATVKASLLLISGCEDAQLSADIGFNGLFTWQLKVVWASGQFQGGHPAFHAAIKQRVLAQNAEQSPAFLRVGANSPKFENARPYAKE